MIQQVGYFVSLFFVILGGIFFLTSIYVGFKNYMQLPHGGESGFKYSVLAVVSFGVAYFVFVTIEAGFSWENVGFSLSFMVIMTLMSKLDEIIRRKTSIYLAKRDALSPLSSLTKLFNLLDKQTPSNKSSDSTEEK